VDGVANLVFDNTGVGWCDVVAGFTPSAPALSAALAAGRSAVRVTSCSVVEVPAVTAEYELVVKGLG
jgi:hypothetical protein